MSASRKLAARLGFKPARQPKRVLPAKTKRRGTPAVLPKRTPWR